MGDGPLLSKLKQQYSKNVNIEFIGWKPANETLELMKGARALIFPSVWYEGAPLTIFEAMSQVFHVSCLIYQQQQILLIKIMAWSLISVIKIGYEIQLRKLSLIYKNTAIDVIVITGRTHLTANGMLTN